MGNVLTIKFAPCPESQNALYQVRYRRTTTDPYTVYPGTFTGSPAMISLPNDAATQQYQGFLDVICNGKAGPSVPWQSGVIP